jgi:hypothetical protein
MEAPQASTGDGRFAEFRELCGGAIPSWPTHAQGVTRYGASSTSDWQKFGHLNTALGTSFALLIGVGVLFVTGAPGRILRPLQRAFARLGWPPI